MTNVLLYFLIPVGMLAVTIVLGFGIYSFARGGKFAKENSNKLMRLRVTLQAVTIAVLMLFVWLLAQNGG